MKRKLVLVLTIVAATAIGGGVVIASAADDPVPVVFREVLGSTRAEGALGYTMYLVRTTAMPGALLAKHYHPGTLNVYILSGTIRYTVFKGSARIFHGPAETATKPVRVIAAGHTGTLTAGDWFVETPSLVHSARVGSKAPFVVLQSGLLKTGEPLSVPVA